MNPYQPVVDFEDAVAKYTGAKYCVAVSSCTAALHLACIWNKVEQVTIPKHTYCSVPMSIINAGGTVKFNNMHWSGVYQLKPYPIYDSARLFTSKMYEAGEYQCVSFHASKTLGIEAGGAILHDNTLADEWFRKARHDGRTPGAAIGNLIIGYHYIMNPSTAAIGLLKLHSLPRHNDPLPKDAYPDLSQFEVFS